MANRFDFDSFFGAQFDRIQNQERLWSKLSGAQIFLTGGTGFFGKWILEALIWANNTQNARITVHVLTRNPEGFRAEYPRLANQTWLSFHRGDVASFAFPDIEITHVIHAATAASLKIINEDPLSMFQTTVKGTERVLEYMATTKAKRILLTSSGGVYGQQPKDMSHLGEDFIGAPNTLCPDSIYGEGKRMSEMLCSIYSKTRHLEPVIARCFAFAGPYLPLDTHFAIGNFIRDSLNGDSIAVNGDGTPYRSYLYGADLAYWLLTLLAFGTPLRAYHVGSEQSLSVREIANTVAKTVGQIDKREIRVCVARVPSAEPPAKYVPSTARTRSEFNLRENFSLEEAIELTTQWCRA